ncbi:selenide, water dikinase SelD [Roseomonas chloroacetimidivorans]|uniref:selenide, water dikinase SelD n=1 Tax=Roseomonas chloroacetimidivorans TaxID=1766656 RepID=UPI003C735E26
MTHSIKLAGAVNMVEEYSLSEYTKDGGCGCKIPADVLEELLINTPIFGHERLLVGVGSRDDAAVYLLSENQALIVSNDFSTPMVSSPYDFGRISAANSISDIYAMGAKPIMAISILGAPYEKVPIETLSLISSGGYDVCVNAGIPVAGGHSINSKDLFYGLTVIGLADPRSILLNDKCNEGDNIIITKPLGSAVYAEASRACKLREQEYEKFIQEAVRLNSIGCILAGMEGVSAATDVTGFGLMGHARNMVRKSKLDIVISASQVPLYDGVLEYASSGYTTGGAIKNWRSYSNFVKVAPGVSRLICMILAEPETNGGLLFSVSRERTQSVLECVRSNGCEGANIVGSVVPGDGTIRIV